MTCPAHDFFEQCSRLHVRDVLRTTLTLRKLERVWCMGMQPLQHLLSSKTMDPGRQAVFKWDEDKRCDELSNKCPSIMLILPIMH